MRQKLNCVLLIDDDEPTNYINEMIISDFDFTKKIVAVQSGAKAIEYLMSMENGYHPQPDLIFLDINMPGMNGWEFLEEYKRLDKNQQGKVVVVMLTTSLNPDDKSKADDISEIDDFRNKPLTEKILEELLEGHFSNKMLVQE